MAAAGEDYQNAKANANAVANANGNGNANANANAIANANANAGHRGDNDTKYFSKTQVFLTNQWDLGFCIDNIIIIWGMH